ncbi:hypothetical protein SDC9_14615 [bioreactor metagenome]|uniref:Uncharacterized protein n=1 Tax=bioreactor metagenome TaxID=1076179 RepID=A0A644TRK3_9ZZZZ
MLFNKINKFLKRFNNIEKKLDLIQGALGRIEERQIKDEDIANAEYKVFSQWGEDGIIQYLVNNLKISKKVFIEFGVENYTESNTRFLLVNNNWSGLVIDGSEKNINYIKQDEIYWRYNLKAECSFITAENINDIFKKNGIQGNIGILSIDIDGNDYWVWNSINSVNPAIITCEYNHRFGKEKAVTVPYDARFVRKEKHYSCIYYGASIKALVLLGQKKGYSLVAGNSNGNNIFFVRNDLLNDRVKPKTVDDVFVHAQFRESRNEDGSLAFLNLEKEKKILEKLELVDVE